MLATALARFPRLVLQPSATSLDFLPRLSAELGRAVYCKRDDTTSLALGGNKVRKLEYLVAEALAEGADTLVTAGAIQSNHVRQTAAVAAQQGLDCVALLENPIATRDPGYLRGGNRLLLELFGAQIKSVAALHDPAGQLAAEAERLRQQGRTPKVIPIGGSNARGALGYIRAGLELADQLQALELQPAAVIVASGSAGTQAGLDLALDHLRPGLPVIGITVSRSNAEQLPRVALLRQQLAELLGVAAPRNAPILYDGYHGPRYGEPNAGTLAAIRRLGRLEGLILDPVYTGKAMAGLLDLAARDELPPGPLVFLHTGGAPGTFAYGDWLA
ncbi:D-cysteine desulfhydrase [Pseudomonas oryzihabitans]|uniref:L-cysteate sulfo-lyase n=1 Tax=Pseudomonas oryzihabitans TaxID=47885 RepID=A0AAJ2BSU9_9PSED|nr:D-cysteine desulfhydrase [Pseudomonas psychrotolerans]MDR6237006.1 D-cysteine desulfhydrase [Pseudomonas psychrotolerans]MDR6353553.1 D-cysteine desulfhydrase [Pseudomonas psychrotolerans]